MGRQGYVNIMKALVNLMVTIMIEAGKVPVESARKLGSNVLKAVTGETE